MGIAPEAYRPGTSAGDRLITHELAHVAQGSGRIQTGDLDVAPASGLSEEEWDVLIEEQKHYMKASDADAAHAELAKDEPPLGHEFWFEVMNDLSVRANNRRAYLLLTEVAIADSAALDEMLTYVDDWAADETATLARIGAGWIYDSDDWWAFPTTWSEKVAKVLQPPNDLDVAQAETNLTNAQSALMDVAAGLPDGLLREGLPLSFGDAIVAKSYALSLVLVELSGPSMVRDFVVAARDYVERFAKHRIAVGWASGKTQLVAAIAAGNKTVDLDAWAEISGGHSSFTLDRTAMEGIDQEVSMLDTLDAAEVDVLKFELALAMAASIRYLAEHIRATRIVRSLFATSLQLADMAVQNLDDDERLGLASRWAARHGYDAAALSLVTRALKENAGEIVVDIAKDVVLSAIPVVGWLWRGKELIEEVADLYSAGEKLYDARQRVQGATTVIGLQRAAAELSMAEVGLGATLAMTAVSEGVSFGAKKLVDKVGGRGDAPGDTRADGGSAGADGRTDVDADASEAGIGSAVRDVAAIADQVAARPGRALRAAADARLVGALQALVSDYPVLHDVGLDAAAIRRIAAKSDANHAKGQLLEELVAVRVRRMTQTPEGRSALGLDRDGSTETVYIEGHRVSLAGKQVTDGIIGHYDVSGIFHIDTVIEAKAGTSAAKGLAKSNTGTSKMTAADQRELVREIHRADADELFEFVRELHSDAADALVAGKYDAIPADALAAIVGDKDLRSTVVGSMTEAGQIARDIERLFPNVGTSNENLGPIDFDHQTLTIDGMGELDVTLSPTRTKFIGAVPSDVDAPKLTEQLGSSYNFEVESFGITSAELDALAQRIRHLVTEIEPDGT